MKQIPTDSEPRFRYAGRVSVDIRGLIVLLDHPRQIALEQAILSDNSYAKIEIIVVRGPTDSADGQCVDLASTEAFRLLREHIFTEDDAAKEWLLTPARALGGAIPAELLQTAAGRKKVEQSVLGIAHGNLL